MRPPQATRIGAVIDALLAACSAIPNLSVIDGPTTEAPRRDLLAIGVGNESMMVTQTQRGLGVAYTEEAQIVCGLSSWSGSAGVKPRRDRCIDLLGQIRAIIDADPRLGGVCDLALMGPQTSWQQGNGSAGSWCSVGFSVQVRTSV